MNKMDLTNINKRLVAIEYPGIVKNKDNMIKTLGGLMNISKTFGTEKRRMDLRFQPENIFCKPVYGDLCSTSGILVKVKVRRRKGAASNTNDSATKTEVIVLGAVNSIVMFESICDYQYVPLVHDPRTNKTTFIYDEIVPKSIQSLDWLHDESAMTIPYFLPPVLFTRVDSCQEGLFRTNTSKEGAAGDGNSTIIGLTRNRRFKHATYIPFSLADPIPDKAHPQALRMLKFKLVTNEQFNLVKEHLERQPIWLRSALMYETKMPRQKLKIILPALAYYYTTGPWRLMWVRFGYDPRKDFASRYYQNLDYRIRTSGLKEQIVLKRAQRSRELAESLTTTQINITDAYPYFDSERLPQSRQAFYRYCDVHIKQIQEMLDKIPTPLSGAICNEKTGWLPPNFDDNCREILNEAVSNLIRKSETDDEDLEDDSFDREYDVELEGEGEGDGDGDADGDGDSMYENDDEDDIFDEDDDFDE